MSFVIDSIHLNGRIVKNDVLRLLPFSRRVNIRRFERNAEIRQRHCWISARKASGTLYRKHLLGQPVAAAFWT